MSDLQLGLLAIGAVIVIAVLAYNKWQEIRYSRLAERSFGAPHEDVLLPSSAPRKEADRQAAHLVPEPPAFGATVAPSEPSERVEPTLGPVPAVESTDVAPSVLVDAIDYIIEIASPDGIQAGAVHQLASELASRTPKAVHLEAWHERASAWGQLNEGETYQRLRLGLQLADRSGGTDAQVIEAFTGGVAGLAAELGASATPADAAAALQRSQALDRLSAEVDVQLALNIIAREKAFSGARLRELAEAAGLALEGDGRYRRRDEQGRELYALLNAAEPAFSPAALQALSTQAVSVEFDVPRAPAQAFEEFIAFARQSANELGGSLVDDNRAELNEGALNAIRAQLQPIHAALAQQGVPAGSAQALRLFS